MFGTQTLEMALVGLNARREEVLQRMADLQRQLGGRSKGVSASTLAHEATAAKKVERKLSASARKRIADAQKLRWAKFHKAAKPAAPAKKATVKKAASEKAPPKRRMSAAAKAKLVANLARARAAKAAKKTEGETVPF